MSLYNNDPREALRQFEIYLSKYPEDYSAYTYYMSLLIRLGHFEDAENFVIWLENRLYSDQNYLSYPERVKILEKHILFTKFKLYAYQERFEDMYELCLNHSDRINELEITSIIFYMKKKLGILNAERSELSSYLLRQLLEYDEQDMLEHIKKHISCYTSEVDSQEKTVFYDSFPIQRVLAEIKKYFTPENRTYPGFIENAYYFRFDNCGKANNHLADYFKVICINNTDNIITIYPCLTSDNLPYTDLNYLRMEDDKPKVKTISQIDKFYKRYGKK